MRYDKQQLQNSINYFNQYTDEDKEMSCYYLGEELVQNSKLLDKFLSDENGGFDPDNEQHVKLFAKVDAINDLLSDLAHGVKFGHPGKQ